MKESERIYTRFLENCKGIRKFSVMLENPNLRDCFPAFVPWSFVENHRKQIEENHDQTLERLHQRGGLDMYELLLAVYGFSLHQKDTSNIPKHVSGQIDFLWYCLYREGFLSFVDPQELPQENPQKAQKAQEETKNLPSSLEIHEELESVKFYLNEKDFISVHITENQELFIVSSGKELRIKPSSSNSIKVEL